MPAKWGEQPMIGRIELGPEKLGATPNTLGFGAPSTFGDPPGSLSSGSLQYDPSRKTAVGDLSSNDKGTGARDNKGKMPAELLPYTAVAHLVPAHKNEPVRDALFALGNFQAGNDLALEDILQHVAKAAGMTLRELVASAADVFAYGMTKYKAWNWAKGMPYSVAMACIYRHLMGDPATNKEGMWDNPQGIDAESGELHAGHVACNVLMLQQWLLTFREGDDRSEHLHRAPF